jgi:Na+-transporting NADH:ubiquinone oxidoreductase subunit C
VHLACALPIAAAAVTLRPKQELNARIDRLSKVLAVAGLMERGESLSAAEQLEARFDASHCGTCRRHAHGRVCRFHRRERRTTSASAAKRPAGERSTAVPENAARVLRVAEHWLSCTRLRATDSLENIIVPIQGYGLWSTMYGYLALAGRIRQDGQSGITFYEHGETAGLGGEIENPSWQAKWVGRRAFNDQGEVTLEVIKGAAGPAADDPFRVDGLSGATITSRGVTATLDFWLGPNGFGPYLDKLRTAAGEAIP